MAKKKAKTKEVKVPDFDTPEPQTERKPWGYWKDKYKPEYSEIASRLAAVGFTEKDIAYSLNVDDMAIQSWKHAFPEFKQACKDGKHTQLKRMAAKAMLECVGYDYKTSKKETVYNPDGSVKQIKEIEFDNHQSPNPNLILFLMCNLSSQLGLGEAESWKSRQKIETETRNLNLTITGEVVGAQIERLAGKLLGESETKQIESTIIDNDINDE